MFSLSALALLLPGCDAMQDVHVSADSSTGHYKGESPVNYSGRTPTENFGYKMSENFIHGLNGNSHTYRYDQPDPYSALAGGPSDGNGANNYSFMRPPAAPAPDNYFTLSEDFEFVGKGFKQDAGGGDTETDQLYYLEVPVLINYNMKLMNNHEVRFGIGPYAAAGLFGHYSSSFQGMSSSGSLKFGTNEDYTRMDYGAVINVGYQICPKVDLSLNYDFGLRNINDPADKLYNRSFGINIGYRIK
jgi:hypothetical protein